MLVVAHFDDEILWFNPYEYDKIVVCFLGRPDKPDFKERRLKVLNEHPLKDKIICLGFEEFSSEEENKDLEFVTGMYNFLKKEADNYDEIHTHNSCGEYGHYHHVFVHNAIEGICKEKIKNSLLDNTYSQEEWFVKIKNIYLKYGCWTWRK